MKLDGPDRVWDSLPTATKEMQPRGHFAGDKTGHKVDPSLDVDYSRITRAVVLGHS